MKKYYIEVDDNGTVYWHRDPDCKILHREDGPAIEWADGDKWWCADGKLHREDGPATEYSCGTKHWYVNGKRHREDGPAIEYSCGTKYWYLHGEELTKEEFLARTRPVEELTVVQTEQLLGERIKIIK